MTEYPNHPLSTNDVQERFAAIATTVVNTEGQFDLVAELEKKR